ncbi:hypothetical protein [Paenibacillus herberti]|uniref:Uncharacterized protein n=1 Tax=Paenibacillus herberti TaxID=1619309 RepID=A0A229P3A7_9BACL|nr:hypothetical protein [Paenibacillus herberti]OXM16776.1 hypothetical protein CGZ75_09010 [Paenibacillus herberti]
MKNIARKTSISNYKGGLGSSMGIILILFILLVIVTQAFSQKQIAPFPIEPPDDGSSSIAISQRFNIINNTQSITFQRTEISGRIIDPLPPTNLLPLGGEQIYNVSIRLNRTAEGTVNYIWYLNDFSRTGELQFTLRVQNVSLEGLYVNTPSIIGISTDAPVRWNTTRERLTISDEV